jgi:hypothetical protein
MMIYIVYNILTELCVYTVKLIINTLIQASYPTTCYNPNTKTRSHSPFYTFGCR